MKKNIFIVFSLLSFFIISKADARIKLVALPDRAEALIRLDNPAATLIEEERVLTLQEGINKVDFSWKGVNIDSDSIHLAILSGSDATLLNVSYPPNEDALVWEIYTKKAIEVPVRVSYLLSNIDRLITYKALANKLETQAGLKSFLILRNFSGEDFQQAKVLIDYGEKFEQSISHEETKQLLLLNIEKLAIEKVWKWDSELQAWDPDKIDVNIGIPVYYKISNTADNGLGRFALWGGKMRVFQEDGYGSSIFLGEDNTKLVPVKEKIEVYIGDSRDIVVTQRKMKEEKISIKRNKNNNIVLYDMDTLIEAKIENFKDSKATLTMLEHIPDEWDMKKCNLDYTKKDSGTIEFVIELPPHSQKELSMNYIRRNIR